MSVGMTILDYAKSRGIEPIRVGKWIADDMLDYIKDSNGRIDPEEADKVLKSDIGRKHEESGFFDDTDDLPAISESKQISEAYKAKLAKLEYESRVGVMIEREAVKRALFSHHRNVRDRILAVPDRIGAIIASLAPEADHLEIRRTIMEECQVCCNELSNPVNYSEFGEEEEENYG